MWCLYRPANMRWWLLRRHGKSWDMEKGFSNALCLFLHHQVCTRWLESESVFGTSKMGRGQQMSSFGLAEPVVITSGKDFWVTNRRKLVITFAIFMPLVIASSYMYFATPGAPSEFFKGRPLASFIPLTVYYLTRVRCIIQNTVRLLYELSGTL